MKPLFASERLLAGPPYRGCGISSDFHGTMLASENEAGHNKHARQMGKGQRRAVLQRGWKAFATQKPADSNGWVDRNDIGLIHKAMFPGYPQPARVTATANWVWDHLDGSDAISIAIDTGAVPSTDAIRRYVGSVPHQVVAYRRKTINGTRWVKIIDPMHRQSELYTGHWVKWRSLKTCAYAIEGAGSVFLAFTYPIGKWTAKAQAWQKASRTIDRVRKQRDEALDIVAEQKARIIAQRTEIAMLTEQLAECRDDKCDAVVEALLDDLNEWVEGRRP